MSGLDGMCDPLFFCPDILLDDGYEGNLRKEGRSVRIVVTINSGFNKTKVNGRVI